MRIRGRFFFPSVAAPPASPENGEAWYDTVLGKFRGQQNGSVVDLSGPGGVPTFRQATKPNLPAGEPYVWYETRADGSVKTKWSGTND